MFSFFFFNDPATTEIYTLSLHDALPIYPLRAGGLLRPVRRAGGVRDGVDGPAADRLVHQLPRPGAGRGEPVRGVVRLPGRSEEHTSELQSQSNLVCRLLLEKKKKTRKHQ